VCLMEGQFTIMMISLGRMVAALSIVGLVLFSGQAWVIAADGPADSPQMSPIELALTQVTSEDESVRDAAILTVVEQGDAEIVFQFFDLGR